MLTIDLFWHWLTWLRKAGTIILCFIGIMLFSVENAEGFTVLHGDIWKLIGPMSGDIPISNEASSLGLYKMIALIDESDNERTVYPTDSQRRIVFVTIFIGFIVAFFSFIGLSALIRWWILRR